MIDDRPRGTSPPGTLEEKAMTDIFDSLPLAPGTLPTNKYKVTPNDGQDLPQPLPRYLVSLDGGTVAFALRDEVTTTPPAPWTFNPGDSVGGRIRRVFSTGTTSTQIWAGY
jgi:hypothetical protein